MAGTWQPACRRVAPKGASSARLSRLISRRLRHERRARCATKLKWRARCAITALRAPALAGTVDDARERRPRRTRTTSRATSRSDSRRAASLPRARESVLVETAEERPS
jgi:hypothetical protein